MDPLFFFVFSPPPPPPPPPLSLSLYFRAVVDSFQLLLICSTSWQATSGASVSIQQDHIPDGVPRPIHVRGKASAVEKACGEIEKLIDTSQYGGIDARTVEQVKTVLVPPHRIGKIIGRGGENIMRFQRESGAHVQLNQHIPKVQSVDRLVIYLFACLFTMDDYIPI